MKIVTVNGKTPEEYGYENSFYAFERGDNAFISAAALVSQCIGYKGIGVTPEQLETGVEIEVILQNDDGKIYKDKNLCKRTEARRPGDYSFIHGRYVPPGVPSALTSSWWMLPDLLRREVAFVAMREEGDRWTIYQFSASPDHPTRSPVLHADGRRADFKDGAEAEATAKHLNSLGAKITPTQYDVARELSAFYYRWRDRQANAARDEASVSVSEEEPEP